ncbi:MAG: hypothetical protein DSY76_07350 [Bacteroidetes bacterium]|nr:MAG: hypothetical protein DSY76_07350 [Bacteroidota bacterium]
MKKTITLLLSLLMISIVYADGFKPISQQSTYYKPLSPLKLAYAPDPNSGNVRPAFNFYGGLGSVNNSNYGFSLGADFEFPIIDPNLTLAPQVIIGTHTYGLGYYDMYGTYHTGTTQFSFSGGVAVRYYADWLIPNMPDDFDVFIMSTIGYGYVSYDSYYSNEAYFSYGFYLGGRWNFKENMSLYVQIGEGANSLSAGLSLKM